MRALAGFIMQGRWQAASVIAGASLLSLLIPILGIPCSLLSLATIALVSLRRGAYEGLWIMAYVLIPAAVANQLMSGNAVKTVMYGLISWLPLWLIALLLRHSQKAIWAVQASALLGMAGVIGVYGFVEQPAEFWHQFLLAMTQPMVDAVKDIDPNASLQPFQQSLAVMAHYMTGFSAAISVGGLLSGLFLGRWWQSLLYNPGGFGAEFLALRAHPAFSLAVLVCAVVAGTDTGWFGEVGGNLLAVLAVLFVTVGISVVHTLLSRSQQRKFLLPLLYVLLMVSVFVPHIMVVIALFGLIDTGLNLRNPISNQTAD